MGAFADEVYLAAGVKRWPLEIAERLLASPLPWGPPAYALGVGYIDDPKQPDQASDFIELAHLVDGAYERHGSAMGVAIQWAMATCEASRAAGSWRSVSTQDLLDMLFLIARGERFTDGLIRSQEAMLREVMQEVVRRVHSDDPPVFLPRPKML